MFKRLMEKIVSIFTYPDLRQETTFQATHNVTEPKPTPGIHREEHLRTMTKAQIDDLALNEYGIKLDRRRKKEDMIAQFLEQVNAGK